MIEKNYIYMHKLSKSFEKQTVLHSVNLTVKPGEIIGLIGPSGAGKSTAIKVLLGMEKGDGGQALVLGTKMPNREILGRIGYMAQSDALYENLSAQENLMFFGKMRGIKTAALQAEIEYVAQVVDLTNHLSKRVSGYSGGMKRRLSLAIAMLGRPELMILDEPTVGIDPALRHKIWVELAKIRDEGRSVLVTTHVMDEAELTDRVALLLHGDIIAFDTPQKLERQYQVKSIEEVFLKAEEEK
ncbi:ABC transporter related [Ligilactobacillus equi DSM 15833 = JCM 10991]|uniref:ABC transporter related n=1 Tax=Ligilactobacillus equi DSM 15833 = JCM 10991 TaxID=1423740 RepID=A0A0R1TTE8_9LACO|nr:ABC transporter ATP-binding protein [Ligilactobacillus equi]KRL81762.1 ABC transporter related [Ligilactobacillus equi DSM 15833 = JCM 10991]